ncbi:TIGR01619 family protein [Necropsobacter massiliensis]|uniref:TIGR01619 family protein n=1 Tax=Necropsobacter massiliensis TaxID=1400001 RepID=UPI0005959867|nr:TIGR01619 family protein [Necropsobacter massiliensis]
MDVTQNWQNYRSMVNDKPAIFAVNLTLLEQYTAGEGKYTKILQFSLPYHAEDNGLPLPEAYQSLLNEIVKVSALLCTLPAVLYAGYIISAQRAKLHFYCNQAAPLLAVLQQFPTITEINEQDDPLWDIYFDFLLPSPLEIKINATEEVLDMLVHNGRNLAEIYLIEHSFHFPQEDDMYHFLDYVTSNDIAFTTLKHTNLPIALDEEENVYLVKLEQELALDDGEIFAYVEKFENMAIQFSGEYVGWESQDAALDKNRLN